MRGRATVPLLAVSICAVAACGPSTAELYQRELNVANMNCQALPEESGGVLRKERECQRLLRPVADKYGHRPDVFAQSVLAYRLAVAERVDRNEITMTQAEYLVKEYQRRVMMEREQMLNTRRQVDAAGRAADAAREQAEATQRAAEATWQLLQQQGVQRAQPIRCTTQYSGNIAYTNCH